MIPSPIDPLRKRLHEAPDLLETLRIRAWILRAIRRFFDDRGFVEVTTPYLIATADPAVHLDSFSTVLKREGMPPVSLFLPTSPETHMKRLVAAGMERIYQMGPFFRNGEMTRLHNPEFLGLEWYQVDAGTPELMELTEQLVSGLADEVSATGGKNLSGKGVIQSPPYRRIAVRDALAELGGIEVPEKFDESGVREALHEAGIHTEASDRFDDLINRALIERVEPALKSLGPVFLTDYPAPMAAMARRKTDSPWLADRFELFAQGLELCNGYGELVDAGEQRQRFEEQRAERRALGKEETGGLDLFFLDALAGGMPPCAGCALGVDRLVMLLCGKQKLEEVLAFPMNYELDPSGVNGT
jgi:elongation factor P--(R)-beta-lysine ligase